jgi:Tfp pilus assembly protein PilN
MKPQRLQLDFAAAAHRPPRVGMVLLVAAAVALAGGAFELSNVVATNARLSDTLAAVDARRDAPAASAAKPASTDPKELARTRAVRKVSQSLMTPWGDLLESLESVPVPSVAVLSIEPSVSKRSIRIVAEAKTAQDMLAYLSALQREPRLSSVVLASHQVQQQAPGAPVRFQVNGTWGAAQ